MKLAWQQQTADGWNNPKLSEFEKMAREHQVRHLMHHV